MKKICSLILLSVVLSAILASCQKIDKVDNGVKEAVSSTQKETTSEILSNNIKNSVIEIVSDTTTLYYPEKWKEEITVSKSKNIVSFTSKGTRLFDFIFGGTEGSLLGYYDEIEVRVVSYEILESDYSEDEYLMLRAMQEDIDVVIEHLIMDEKFVLK